MDKHMDLEKKHLRKQPLAKFEIGDTVDVQVTIKEGDKERIQTFNGTVIAKRGGGVSEMFTVRRIVQDEGVERVFPVNSPKIAGIEVKRQGRVRRAKLNYLRGRTGKAVRLTERRDDKPAADAKAAKGAAPKK
ncbi:MAG TPA: 50S ribosomal protein L19 [Planctomycetota bacterium]|nr:50S ribosomal protein L19 [Planctomycetota bacterium]